MRDHQIPAIVQMFQNVVLNVRSEIFSGQQVTRPSIMAAVTEGVAHNAGEFAGDKNSHALPSCSRERHGVQKPISMSPRRPM